MTCVARAADTIADTRALAPAARLAALHALRGALGDDWRGPDSGRPSGGRSDPRRSAPSLARLPEVLAAYRALDPADRKRARAVLLTLTQAMVESLDGFRPRWRIAWTPSTLGPT